jgi:hypothetical protein
MTSDNATARIVGILFIIASAAAVLSNLILNPLRDDANYLTEFAANENRVILGVLSELTLAVAVVAIAVLLYPVLKRSDDGMALGYVGARTLEGAIIIVGAISSLLLLTLSQTAVSGASDVVESSSMGAALLEARNWTDSLGQMIVFSLSALILYALLYRTRIVPRWLSGWGFAGAILLMAAGVLTMYGESATSTTSIMLTLPIGINEMVLALWLIVRGFESATAASDASANSIDDASSERFSEVAHQ